MFNCLIDKTKRCHDELKIEFVVDSSALHGVVSAHVVKTSLITKVPAYSMVIEQILSQLFKTHCNLQRENISSQSTQRLSDGLPIGQQKFVFILSFPLLICFDIFSYSSILDWLHGKPCDSCLNGTSLSTTKQILSLF